MRVPGSVSGFVPFGVSEAIQTGSNTEARNNTGAQGEELLREKQQQVRGLWGFCLSCLCPSPGVFGPEEAARPSQLLAVRCKYIHPGGIRYSRDPRRR